MKKIFLYYFVVLFLLIPVYSEEITIYEQIKNIKANPRSYNLVVGESATEEEVKLASELIAFFGITQTTFDTGVNINNNLVIIGIVGNNKKIFDNVNEIEVKDILIKAVNNNLVIAVSNIDNLKKAVDIIKNYEPNKKKLLKEKLGSESEGLLHSLLSPITTIFSNIIIAYIMVTFLVVGASTTVIVRHRRKSKQKRQAFNPLRRQFVQNQAYIQLRRYIYENLRRGYNEEQIMSSLLSSGWNPHQLNPIFNEIRYFQRRQY